MTFVGLVLHLLGHIIQKSCQLMHIYSVEVEDTQTCHDFWKKKQLQCGQHELWVNWVFYND
jgi:hypothetical protein